MKHKLRISVSKEPQTDGFITCRNIRVRERLLRYFLGDRRRVAVLIPGDKVKEIVICDTEKGDQDDGSIEVFERSSPFAYEDH